MISISGIKYQQEIESMPFLSKNALATLIGKEGKNLDAKLAQLAKIGYLETLKKGTYVASPFVDRVDKRAYLEYLANVLRSPSYISLEYVLAQKGLIPESVFAITSITVKSPRVYSGDLGVFSYRNIKKSLFGGFEQQRWEDKVIYIATKAKALFDYFYLKKILDFKADIAQTRLNWNNFNRTNLAEFKRYVDLSESVKMAKVYKYIKEYVD